MKMDLPPVLEAPKLPNGLSKKTQWLAGEGAGSWFSIEKEESTFLISRFSPEGELECLGYFTTEDSFFIEETYHVTYPSHCAKVTITQNRKKIIFTRIDVE